MTVAAEPDSIEITGPSTRSGTVNEALEYTAARPSP